MRSQWIAGTIGFLAAASAWPSAAQAQVTGQVEVKLLVTASCDVSGSAAGKLGNAVLDFGSATLLQDAINGQTATSGAQAFQVLCNPGVAYTLSFNAGQNAALVANRAMKLDVGPEMVRYQLYSDAGRGTVLTTIGGTGTGSAQIINIYGAVPPQAAPKAGNYKDVVTVTVTF